MGEYTGISSIEKRYGSKPHPYTGRGILRLEDPDDTGRVVIHYTDGSMGHLHVPMPVSVVGVTREAGELVFAMSDGTEHRVPMP